MKARKTTESKDLLSDAFEMINDSVGEDLDRIVSVIEQHGKKQKVKPVEKAKVKQTASLVLQAH